MIEVIYRGVSRYAPLAPGGVAGNPERSRPDELHARAWPLVEPLFKQARQAALARFRQLAGTGRTSTNLAEILPAVSQGRVEILFVATDRQQWGTFDDEPLGTALRDAERGNEDPLTGRRREAYSGGAVTQ